MVTLTDAQIAAITNATRPLQPAERTAFMAALFEILINYREQLGDGSLGRLIRDLQRRFFRPPADTEGRLIGARYNSRGVFKAARE
jgi:hypothetical protein